MNFYLVLDVSVLASMLVFLISFAYFASKAVDTEAKRMSVFPDAEALTASRLPFGKFVRS